MKSTIALLLLSLPGFAAQQTWTGQISDDMCGANHAAMGDMGKNPKDCTAACVKGGGKYVLVSNAKVFEIANQNFGDLTKASGQTVTLTGDLGKNGKTITVTKIAPKRTAIQEMGHVEALADRILFLKGDVDMAATEPVEKITQPAKMLAKAVAMEKTSARDYNKAALDCSANEDAGSKQLFQRLIQDEESHFAEFEQQQNNIKEFGLN